MEIDLFCILYYMIRISLVAIAISICAAHPPLELKKVTDIPLPASGGIRRRRGMLIAKTPSVPGDYSAGVTNALNEVVDDYREIELFINGTTAPLNAFLERKGARTALITTGGFGDVYVIRRSNRMRMYDLHYSHPEPLVPRRLTFEVEERLNARGEVVTPLNEAISRRSFPGCARPASSRSPSASCTATSIPSTSGSPRSSFVARRRICSSRLLSRSAASGASTSAPAPSSSTRMSRRS